MYSVFSDAKLENENVNVNQTKNIRVVIIREAKENDLNMNTGAKIPKTSANAIVNDIILIFIS